MTTKKLEKLTKALGILTLKSRLTFGKYKRKTLAFVLENDPGYIVWLSENTNQVIDKKLIAGAKELHGEMEEFDILQEIEDTVGFSIEDTF